MIDSQGNIDYNTFMRKQQLIAEWNLFNDLTNNRSFKSNDVDKHKETVVNGYNKIMRFVGRGIK